MRSQEQRQLRGCPRQHQYQYTLKTKTKQKKLHDNSRISMGIYTAIGKEEFVNLEVHSVSRQGLIT